MRLTPFLATVQLLMLSNSVSWAQAASVTTMDLGPPDAEFASPFDHVTAICELRDKRVIVLDSVSRTVSIVDLQRGTSSPVGREGDGPGEYRLPVRLVALTPDSCAIVDLARPRSVQVLDPQGMPARTHSLQGTQGNPGPGFPRYGDTLGHLLALVRGGADSMVVARWRLAPWRRDSVSRISVRPVSSLPVARETHDPPPFTTYDTWTVSRDGLVAITTVDPYRVTLVAPDGSRTTGPPVTDARERVTNAHREEWRRIRERPRTRYLLESGGLKAAVARVQYVEPARWPDVLPPFLGNATSFAFDGALWVQRAGLAAAKQRVDVFDRLGTRQRQLLFPPESRIVGHGAGAVYVAIRSADDLERLVRYDLR